MQTLVFLGPMHPAAAENISEVASDLWVTLGAFNVIAKALTRDAADHILNFATDRQIRFEAWEIQDGVITGLRVSNPPPTGDAWRAELEGLANATHPGELRDVVREYCPLMASGVTRCAETFPDIVDDLVAANRYTTDLLKPANDADVLYEQLANMATLNAGLSRFTSQAFSGTSPIFETECHYWIHSLLGTGVVNLALARIARYVANTIGECRISLRVEGYRRAKTQVPDLQRISPKAALWSQDHLGDVELEPQERTEPLFPLITYLSGRDSYLSTVNTLSAPLGVVAASNSLRWSLLTLTHELSHSIVRGIVSLLYPDSKSDTELEEADRLLNSSGPAADLLSEIKRYLLIAIKKMQEAELTGPRTKLDLDILLQNWKTNVEEIFAHIFDFLYFYRGDHTKYVPGIWLSWGVVPNIVTRVPEYVIRTLCAVETRLLHKSDPEEAARQRVLKMLDDELNKAKRSGESIAYLEAAIEQLTDDWEDQVRPRMDARRPLVRIGATYLYSPRLATEIGRELGKKPSAKVRGGYRFRPRKFDDTPLHDPLYFIERFTTARTPSAIDSAWMLSTLAFNTSKT